MLQLYVGAGHPLIASRLVAGAGAFHRQVAQPGGVDVPGRHRHVRQPGRDEPQVEREFLAQPRGVGHRAGAAGERRGHLRPGPQVRGAGGR